jgi:hypothetical protein
MTQHKIYPILGARVCDGVLETCTGYGQIDYNDAKLCNDCFNALQANLASKVHARLDL